MDPVTMAVAATAATSATDISGLIDLIGGISAAAGNGNWWWIISLCVFSLLELAKGRIPGTNIIVPGIPAFLAGKFGPNTIKGITLGLSAVIAVIFVVSGRPIDSAVADFAQGWIGAMGLHEASDAVKGLLPGKKS